MVFVFKEKPSAEVSPRPHPKLSVGSELRLTCEVNKATVKIIWKKDNDTGIPRGQIDTQLDDKLSKLFIEEVVESDSGEYSCEAHNRPGIVARSAVKINVMGKMTFPLFGRGKLSVIQYVKKHYSCILVGSCLLSIGGQI